MTTSRPRGGECRKVIFDVGALRRVAGTKLFARGYDYFQDGLVEIFRLADAVLYGATCGDSPLTDLEKTRQLSP